MAAEGRDVVGGPVFCDTDCGLLRQSNVIRRTLRPTLEAAKLPTIRPYDLRHTAATPLLSRDVNIRVVSERLGHESIERTLKHNVHALSHVQQRAAEVIQSLFSEIVPPQSHERQEQIAVVDASLTV
jgi:integrase